MKLNDFIRRIKVIEIFQKDTKILNYKDLS